MMAFIRSPQSGTIDLFKYGIKKMLEVLEKIKTSILRDEIEAAKLKAIKQANLLR